MGMSSVLLQGQVMWRMPVLGVVGMVVSVVVVVEEKVHLLMTYVWRFFDKLMARSDLQTSLESN